MSRACPGYRVQQLYIDAGHPARQLGGAVLLQLLGLLPTTPGNDVPFGHIHPDDKQSRRSSMPMGLGAVC